MSDNPSGTPEPAPEPTAPVSNVEFAVTGRTATITTRIVELAAVKDGERIPLVTMSISAAKRLRDMLSTEIAFEDQLPPEG